MRFIFLIILLAVFTTHSFCQTNAQKHTIATDTVQIKNLVIEVLKWHAKHNSYLGYVPIYNLKDSLVTSMDLDTLNSALETLTKTNYFDKEFIENYRNIVLKIDWKIKHKEMSWLNGDLPPFAGADPWCSCQDEPFENPWDKIVVTIKNIDKEKAELTWTWDSTNWYKEFSYTVRVKKIGGIWKINFLQGFDIDKLSR